MRDLENLKMRRTRVARKLARFVIFVGGSLFEKYMYEEICGRFGRIGV